MKTYWIEFKQGFTDYSEGESIAVAVAKLGMSINDVVQWKALN